jgi:hypothetical protein
LRVLPLWYFSRMALIFNIIFIDNMDIIRSA